MLIACLVFCLAGCSRKEATPCHLVPLYRAAAQWPRTPDTARDSILHADSAELRAMFAVSGIHAPLDSAMDMWSRSMAVKIFTPPTDSVFPTLTPLSEALGIILANAADAGIDFPKRRYAAVVWGNMKSIVFADSTMLIALNHYLGADYPGYAGRWPDYMRTTKTPAHLPYDIAEALVAVRYHFVESEQATVLSHLLYEGAIVKAVLTLVPDATLAEVLGWTDDQLKWAEENSQNLWRVVVGRRLLYDTSRATASRLLDPAPSTSVLSPEAPGRTGRFIGYSIICAYIEAHGKVALPDLLSPEFYNNQSVLIESGYTGNCAAVTPGRRRNRTRHRS